MNYEYIESLVKYSKDGNEDAKEKLVMQFRPYILNLCSRTFVHGYDFDDIQNECYKILFKCLSMYNPQNHRFVAYATNGIKNSIFDLIRRYNNRKIFEGSESLILSSQLEDTLKSDSMTAEDITCKRDSYNELKLALTNLSKHEQELINYLFFNGENTDLKPTIKNYAYSKSISYSCALKRKNTALKKLKNYIIENENRGESYGS